MEVASNHRQDNSFSSFGSLLSADESPILIDDGISDLQPQSRKRLGAEMAIIAATSPEIKALNLPITPSFPEPMDFGHFRTNSTDTYSSVSSSSTHQNRTLTPLLAALDDVEDQPMQIFLDETDDLFRPFHNLVEDPIQKYMEDKENIHPNLLQSKLNGDTRKKPFGMRANMKRHPPKKLNSEITPRGSLHRRASCNALPSTDEIGHFPRVMKRAATCGSLPFFPSDLDRKSLDRRVPKSMSLTTCFR